MCIRDSPGVDIPQRLKESHPEKMTIILQHQYWDLDITDDQFSVSLSFGGQRETLVVPFMAVVDFNDPSVGFGLQFATDQLDEDTIIDEGETLPEADQEQQEDDGAQASADVVSLDTFRKKT